MIILVIGFGSLLQANANVILPAPEDNPSRYLRHLDRLDDPSHYFDVDSLQSFAPRMKAFDDRFRSSRTESARFSVMYNQAMTAYLNNHHQEAVSLLDSLGLTQLPDLRLRGTEQATILLRAGDVTRARNRLEALLKTNAREMPTRMRLYELLAQCYGNLGQPDNELRAMKNYVAIKDSLFSMQEFVRIKDFNFSSQIREMDKELLEISAAKKNRETVLWILVGVLLMIVAFSLVIVRQKRNLQRSYDMLYARSREQMESGELPDTSALTVSEGGVEEENAQEEEENIGRETKWLLTEGQVAEYMEKIKAAMEASDIWTDAEFSLHSLSMATGINSRYLSEAIARGFNTNFYGMTMAYRVRRVCDMLANPQYANLTLEAIGTQAGFKSRSYFSRVFKKVTGLSPSEYQRKSKRDISNN